MSVKVIMSQTLASFFNPLDISQRAMYIQIDQEVRRIDSALGDNKGVIAFDACETALDNFPGEPVLHIRKLEAIRQADFVPRFRNKESRESLAMLNWLAAKRYNYTVEEIINSAYFNNILHYYRNTGMARFEFEAAQAAHTYFPGDQHFQSIHARVVRRHQRKFKVG